MLRRAVSAFRGTDVSREEGLRWLWLACRAALIVWDYASWDVLSDRQVTLARDAGALIALPIAFNMRSTVHLFAGEFTEAASLVAQAESVTEATGSSIAPYGALALAVFRGREAQAAHLIQTATDDAGRRGEGASAQLRRSGRPRCCTTAWAAMRRRWPRRSGRARTPLRCSSPTGRSSSWLRRRCAARYPSARPAPLQRLSGIARACGTDWALGAEARSRALVSDGEAAENLYREAIDRFGRTRLRVDLARARLLYGEWLRRQRRRRDARDQLGRAYQIFDSIGAAAFAERARIELRATGGHARQHTTETPDTLTAQEALIARLAGDGASNPRDRRAAVHQPRHRRLPPAEGLHQARHQLTQPACSRASRTARRSTAGHAAGLIPKADPRTAAAVPAWPTIKTLSTIGSRLSTLTDAHRCASNIAWMS